MSELTKIEKSIATINFLLKKRKEKVAEMERRTDLNENQKIFIGQEYDLIRNVEVLVKRYRDDINKNLGKLPPQELSLEEAILGALLLETPSLKILKFISDEHFYSEAHKNICKAIIAINNRNESVDMRTVVVELRKRGELEISGGAYYIAELTSKVNSSANIEFHARILIEAAIKRRIIEMAGRLMEEGYNDSSDCFELLEHAESEIKSIRAWIK